MGSARRGSNPLAVVVAFSASVGFINSATGTRTRVARVRAECPNQLDYSGVACMARCAPIIAIWFVLRNFRVGSVIVASRILACLFANMTPAGLEPAIPGSVGRCLIHWATGPLMVSLCWVAFVIVFGEYFVFGDVLRGLCGFGHKCVCFHSSVG